MYTLAKSYIYSTHSSSCCCSLCVVVSHRYRYILGGSRKTNLSRRHTGFSAGSRVSHTVSLYIGLQGRCGSGQVRDGTERWEAGCVLVQLELTGVAPEDIVARLPADLLLHVELRRVSCCLLQHRERAASLASILAPRTGLSTGASPSGGLVAFGLVVFGLVAFGLAAFGLLAVPETWKAAILAPILAPILAEAEGCLRRELESCWCSGSPWIRLHWLGRVSWLSELIGRGELERVSLSGEPERGEPERGEPERGEPERGELERGKLEREPRGEADSGAVRELRRAGIDVMEVSLTLRGV